MKQMSLRKVAIATSTVACAALLSFSWSEQRGVSLSIENAQARVGRPLTPVSVAGVARRQHRRAVYGTGVVGAGVAGAAAIGTAGAVAAATSPVWGGGPYYTGPRAYQATSPVWGGGAYYTGPRAYQSYAAAPAASSPAWNLTTAYRAGGPWYGHNGWGDYKARYGIVCDPGGMIKGGDGLMYRCQ
ncbi:hypothetical protein [Bradyrhizobium sp.]|uniref:hypothetical protein n=1 Tax=Bradyrhizobium sp. TaxID=376 RepID=UPI0025C6AFD3|nr:hypothetical protein [Bradyrhizobium sp.]